MWCVILGLIVLSGLTLAITGVQKQNEAPLLRVRVDGVVEPHVAHL